MGIVHKLKPEVLNFILENKKNNPALSCRNLTQLTLEKFQITVSKSSINAIFKENNLSMPIGRRQKQKRKKFNLPVLPVIEGTKAVTVIVEPEKQGDGSTFPESKAGKVEPSPDLQPTPEEKRIKEAEEWAVKLQEEERIRIEEKLKVEKQEPEAEDVKKKAEETEVRALLEEAARIKVKEEDRQRELEKAVQEAAEKKRLEEEVAKATAEKKRLEEEESKRIEEEKVAQEAKLRAEEERLAKLLEEEAKQREIEKATQEAAQERRLEEERIAQEAKLKAEQERLAKFAEEETAKVAVEKKRLEEEAANAATEKKRLEEEAKKIEEERIAEEAGLKEEREKWARLAEEEHKAKQQQAGEVVLPKEELTTASSPPGGRDCSGAILLKALDCLIGGSKEINEAICKEMGVLPEDYLNLTEAVIFRSLFGKDNMGAFGNIAGQEYSPDKLDNYYAQLKQLKNIKSEIAKIFSGIFTEARGLKLHFIDGSVVQLDAQLHSTWSTQNIPYDFSATVYELKNNLNRYFLQSRPLILFSAPGYDVVPKDFFNLLLNIGSTDKYPDTLTIFGNKSEDLEKISLNNKNSYSLIFGIWPWQFTSSRKVKKIGDFNLRRIEGIDKDFYLADIEIDLLQAPMNQSIALKGCAIKTTPTEKIRLVILNNSKEPMALDELAGFYLNRWPNLDEAVHDFSRKIELFAYVSNAQKFFSKDSCGIEINIGAPTLELEGIFVKYIKILDAYLRWHFFSSGYIENDFTFTSKHFYKIPVKLISGKDKITARMQIEQGYQFLKDLEYLIRRLNERQINLADGARLYFENAFK